jgi:hypothetical protein
MAAVAQQPGQQRGDGQKGEGRGRGGPGGGMFFGGGAGMSRMMLLGIPEVQKELELADEQVKEIQKIQEEFRARFRGGPGGPGAGPGGRGRGDGNRGDGNRGEAKRGDRTSNAVPADWYFVQAQQEQPRRPGGGAGFQITEEQRAEIEKRRLEQGREERAKLAEILLPHQLERLTQIYVQLAGVEALRDEEVAKELGISDAQAAKLTEVRNANREELGPQMRELFGGGGGDRDAIRAKMDELRKAGDAKILAVLTSEQQKKFEELKGKPFKMPEGFGRGGPGGGPGRRGGDNNRN